MAQFAYSLLGERNSRRQGRNPKESDEARSKEDRR
jgi:hypothetical protein